MKNKIGAIIVFYNSVINQSQAYRLLQNSKIDLFLVDNSTDSDFLQENQRYCLEHNLNYYPMNGNIGLSKAYNKMIDELKVFGYEYVLLSDDDTLYTQEYINQLVDAVDNQKAKVILPTIRDEKYGYVISPVFSTKIPLIPYKEGGKLKVNKVHGINSGTCISLDCFGQWRFNEEIFLYFVDSDFFVNNVNKNKLSYYVLDCEIKQNLSSSNDFTDASLERLKLVLKDARPFFKSQTFSTMRLFIYKLSLINRFWKQDHDKRIFNILKY